jgi:hypothetical protein
VPSDAAWNRVMAGVKESLNPATPAPSYRTSNQRKWTGWALAASAIAAMFLVFMGPSFVSKPNNSVNTPFSAGDALQLVHADDVTILSLQGDDDVIVVGRSPLTGPIDLVTVGDTELWATSTDLSETPSKPNIAPGDPNRRAWWNPADKMIPVP